MREPVRILSDLHLGHKVSRIENVSSLRPLIAGMGTVIFNGDTWQEIAQPFRKRSELMLRELQSICEEEAVDAIFLSGNHDPGWEGRGWVELAGGRIIVTHGDALWFDGSPWKREVLVAGERVMELWKQHPAAEYDIEVRLRLARAISLDLSSVTHPQGRHWIQRALDAVMPPKRAIKMLEAWFTQGAAGKRFCDRYFPQAKVLIIGHFHYQGCWENDSLMVINTGSFMAPGRAHWVDWCDGWLSRGEILESTEGCKIGKTLGRWRF